MARRNQPQLATRRRGVVLLAVVMWIVVIAAGAGSDADDSLLGVDNLDVAWIVLFSIVVLASIAFLIWLHPFSGEWAEPEKKKRGLGFWGLAAAIVALLIWRPDLLSAITNEEIGQELGGVFEVEAEVVPEEAPAETVAQLTDLLLVGLVIAVIGAVWVFLKWRTADGPELGDDHAPSALEIDLMQALDLAASELDASTDPRTAVLRAYAVLETVLASHGLTRARAETPSEHLRRALQDLRIDATPVAQLGGLYEIARFSERSISTQQQDDAVAALRRAQASLASLA